MHYVKSILVLVHICIHNRYSTHTHIRLLCKYSTAQLNLHRPPPSLPLLTNQPINRTPTPSYPTPHQGQNPPSQNQTRPID